MKSSAPKVQPIVIRIRPTRKWGSVDLRELWDYRDLLWFLTTRNIKGRYRQMALGPLWVIAQPLITMIMFSLIFGRLAKLPSDGLPYPLFTYTALIPWTFFSTATQGAVGSLVSQMSVISKVYFPRLVIPISAIFVGLVDLTVSMVILLGMMMGYGIAPSWKMSVLPLYVILAAATGLAVGLWNATLAVRFRDLKFVTQYGIRVWMWATPVAYSAQLIPDRWKILYQMNPLYWVVEGFRWALLGKGQAPGPTMALPVIFVTLLLISGALVFRRTEKTVVDLL